MANICHNRLCVLIREDVDREDDEYPLDAFEKFAKGENPEFRDPRPDSTKPPADRTTLLCFHNFLPIPAELLARTYGAEAEEREGRAAPVDGFISGYDWCSHRWGTKWPAHKVSMDHRIYYLEYRFQTAWCMPVPLLQAMSRQFPNLEFQADSRDEYDACRTLKWIRCVGGVAHDAEGEL